jgi:polysaccharide export outer membrane protein
MGNDWEVAMRFHKLQILALVLIAAVIATASGMAQVQSSAPQAPATSSPASTPAPAPTTTPTESLLIGPGDMLHVQVFDTPEMDQHARVTDDGNVPLIFLGNVHVAGLTPEAAARTIEAGLQQKEYMKHPQVTVSIDQYGTQGVLVIGEVKTPGSYQIETSRPVLDVLSLAGGLGDLANRRITIERHGTGERIQYFVSNNPEEAFDHSVLIHPGDKIMVPRASIVYALGDVGRPGGFTMNNNKSELSVLQMIALAGGTPSSASPSAARLIRKTADGYQDIHIQLSDMQKGKIPDIPLQADDIVYVPFSYLKNMASNASQIVAAAGGAAIYSF